jgi:hypothetical protein
MFKTFFKSKKLLTKQITKQQSSLSDFDTLQNKLLQQSAKQFNNKNLLELTK